MRLYVLVSMHSWIMNDFVDSHALNFTVLAVLDDMNAGGWWKTNRAHVTFGATSSDRNKKLIFEILESPSSPLKQPAPSPEQPAQAALLTLSISSSVPKVLLPKFYLTISVTSYTRSVKRATPTRLTHCDIFLLWLDT
jgi:hypothetical protein